MLSDYPSMYQLAISLIVNNEPCHEINLSMEGDVPVNLPIDVILNISTVCRSARRYNGLYELLFLMELKDNNINDSGKGRIVGHALLPSGETHYLGPLLHSGNSVVSAIFLENIPNNLQIRFNIDTCVPVDIVAAWPAEILLVDHVIAIIDNDDLSGSVASSHVQNLVRELPFYVSGMKRFKNWSNFVRFFATYYHSWELVQYSEELHERLGFSKLMLPGELRLVSKKFVNSYVKADKSRDIIRYEAFLEFQQLLLSFTGPPDNTRRAPKLSNEAFKILGESRSFRTLNTVNYIRILKLVALDPERYVLFDPLHPIRIDWRHSDKTTPGITEISSTRVKRLKY